MPTYAVLGATGATGQALLEILSQSPKHEVNAYVRSAAKLERLRPGISKSDNVRIFEGDLFDVPLIARCISDVSTVFAVVATNENIPNLTIAQDTAHVIVAALCTLRARYPGMRVPRIIVLSSSTINPHLSRDKPRWVQWLLLRALSNLYRDLELAEKYWRLHRAWLEVTFIQPGGLVHDTQKGHVLSLDKERTFLSYLDLAAGMVEVANSDGEYDWKGVAVVPTGKDVKIEWRTPLTLVEGLLFHIFPWVYGIVKYLGIY